jgi:hypothetical protein
MGGDILQGTHIDILHFFAGLLPTFMVTLGIGLARAAFAL